MAPRAGHARRWFGDAGQVLPLMALVILVGLGAALGLARLGVEVIDRARARTAADAAALAGVDGGRQAADAAARANGGRVVRFVATDGATEVEVRVGGSQATARARRGAPMAATDRTVAPVPARRWRPSSGGKPSGSARPGRLRSMRSKRGYSSVG